MHVEPPILVDRLEDGNVHMMCADSAYLCPQPMTGEFLAGLVREVELGNWDVVSSPAVLLPLPVRRGAVVRLPVARLLYQIAGLLVRFSGDAWLNATPA